MSGSNFGQPQPPLNPYGFSGAVSVSDRTWSGEYMTAAFDRARYKIANVAGEPPVGPDQTYRTYAIINLFLGLAWLAMTVVALGTTGNLVGGIIWPIALIAGSSYWFKWHKASNPNEPAHAVQAWIGAIMRRKWERVDRLRLNSDRDKFPRRLPLKEGAIELPMETVYDVENYWKECRRSIGLHRGRWTLKKPNVRPQGQGIALVNIEVSTPKLPQFYSLVALGGFVFLVAAMITVIVTLDKVDDWFAVFPLLILLFLVVMLVVIGWRRKHQIQKVVVYNGTEWRLLSGEWQAPEDRDLRWLRQR